MRFAELPLQDTLGCILAHSVRHANGVFKKGRKLAADDLKLLTASGVSKIFVAKLDVDDVPEDEAARAIAGKIAGSGAMAQEPFTGRANVYAQQRGLVVVLRLILADDRETRAELHGSSSLGDRAELTRTLRSGARRPA